MDINKLKDLIQSSNINFLIGSGMSAPYLSTLGNVENLLTEIDNDKDIKEDGRLLIKASIFKKFFEDIIEKNINILNNEKKSCRMILQYQKFFSNINKLLLLRRNKLSNKQVNIFTTNIDICLEKGVENKGVEFNDGFYGRFNLKYDLSNFKKSIYKKSLHYDNNSEIPVFNLLKLHGSLTWDINEENNDILFNSNLMQINEIQDLLKNLSCEFIPLENNTTLDNMKENLPTSISTLELEAFVKEYEKLTIVNPTKKKFKDTLLNQTYYDLLRIYSNELEKENSILFVMGFSFADEHIRELTVRVANSNPTLLIIIIAYNNDAEKDLKENIGMSKIKNDNVIFETPPITENEDKEMIDEFKYNFHNINNKIFKTLLKKIEG